MTHLKKRLPRLLLIVLGLFFLSMVIAFIGIQRSLLRTIPDEIKKNAPFPIRFAKARWSWPVGVTLEDVTLQNGSDPARPDLSVIHHVTFQVPIWAVFMRSLPVEISLVKPRISLDTATLHSLGTLFSQRMGQEEMTQASLMKWLKQGGFPRRGGTPSLVPIGLHVSEGRFDFTDPQVRTDGPLVVLDHLRADVNLTPVPTPTIQFSSDGQFVDADGKQIGFIQMNSTTQVTAGAMQGHLQIWHDRLKDFRSIYSYASEPFYFEDGAGGPIIDWMIRDGVYLTVSVRCLAKGLKISGTAGGVPWNSILNAIEESPGSLDLTVHAQGRLDDPAFDPHDRLLSEGDWLCKEKAAAAGIQIPGRIFFALNPPETPSSLEEEKESLEELDEEETE